MAYIPLKVIFQTITKLKSKIKFAKLFQDSATAQKNQREF